MNDKFKYILFHIITIIIGLILIISGIHGLENSLLH